MRKALLYITCLLATFLPAAAGIAEGAADPRLNLPKTVSIDDILVNLNSVDPESDAAAIRAMRARMAKIRRKRPTVALVLSGGGAKGVAHLGIIDYLDSLQIPVDMVLGTSMGGLVGGLYALGYTVPEMDSLVRNMDWSLALSDNLPREYISYNEMKYREKYLLEIPFYYDKDSFRSKVEADIKYEPLVKEPDFNPLKIGAAGNKDYSSFLKSNLLRSLPSGYVSGQNVSNIISSMSVGYQDNMNFLDLPIPFVCIAADLVSGKAKIWHEGKINTALRSTMSIPGFFNPVRTEGMVLVDGGLRNNYPTDLAKMMGADIVIGVTLASADRTYMDINNLADIVSQGIDMLGKDAYERNVGIPDVTIRPDITGYSMMSFDKRSVDTLIARGYAAAAAQLDELKAVKKRVGRSKPSLAGKPAIDLSRDTVLIDQVVIDGVSSQEGEILMKRIKVKPGDRLTKSDCEDIVAQIYSTNAYNFVKYELEGTGEPFRLVVLCNKGPVHQLGVGLRADTEEIVSILINVGLNARRISGSRYDFTAKLGANPYLKFHYSYDHPKMPTINATASVGWTDSDIMHVKDDRLSRMNFLRARQEFFFSNIKWSKLDINAGLTNDFFHFTYLTPDIPVLNEADHNDYLSLRLKAMMDTFDDGYFPTKGLSAGLSYNWTFAGFPVKFKNFHALRFGIKGVGSAGLFSFVPSLDCRFLLGDTPPLPYINIFGGNMDGRYAEQQMSFVGTTNVIPAESIMTKFRTDFRFRVARNHYVTGIFNYLRDARDFKTYVTEDARNFFGVALDYSYDTLLGPISAGLTWSNVVKNVGFYLSFGFNF